MKLLEKYTNNILELFEIDHLDNIVDMAIYEGGIKLINKGNPWDFWWRVECLEEKYNPRLTFNQKKQLFLELIEYYMKKGLLRFEGEAGTKLYRDINDEGCEHTGISEIVFFEKDTPIKDILSHFDKYFPKESDVEKIGRNMESLINDFLYCNCPSAYWFWKDPEDPKDEGEWYKCD